MVGSRRGLTGARATEAELTAERRSHGLHSARASNKA